MEHVIVIWSKRKTGKEDFIIEDRQTLTEEQIGEFALKQFKNRKGSLNEDREYWAELEETKH